MTFPSSNYNYSILISCSLSKNGGNETHVMSLCRELRKYGIPITVASRSKDFIQKNQQILKQMGIRIWTTPFSSPYPSYIKNLWAYVFWLHFFDQHYERLLAIGPGGFHRLMKNVLKNPGWSLYWEAGDGSYTLNSSQNNMLNAMDRLAATTCTIANKMSKLLSRKVDVLPPLTSISTHRIVPAKFHNNNDNVRVVYIGRLSKLKGVDILVDVWRELTDKKCTLDIYGEGDIFDSLMKRVVESKLDDLIKFRGIFNRTADLWNIYGDYDFLILPSLSEGLPHVLIEAMAYGIPFVATNVGGICDVTYGNPNLILVEPNKNDILNGIQTMIGKIRKNSINRKEIYDFYVSNYSFDVSVQKWMKYLK